VSAARNFGEMLRRQRERRGIALKAVAEQTKIGSSLLAALERGDCSRWPGGIYSRAWIRAYATAIGLDPGEVGAQFNRCFSRVAFPDGEPAAMSLAALAELPRITPLRLTLAADPHERIHRLVRRALFFLADLLLAALAAYAVATLSAVTFWTAFASAAIACHAVGLFGGGGSAAAWIERTVRRHARPHEDPSEAAVAEAA
jgi:transcriptional regulator with XRE-family HTH domain